MLVTALVRLYSGNVAGVTVINYVSQPMYVGRGTYEQGYVNDVI
ncbi:MAG: hypothetical protein ABSB14_19070 [Candidatus Sulfotelmatobacter sp.]